MNPTRLAALPPAPEQERNPDRRITAAQVRDICGGISDMSLYRWLADETLGFPRPAVVARRRFWLEREVLEWWEARQG